MSALINALFDQGMANTAEGFGAKDITTLPMQSAIKEWFALYFTREVTETEDPCQRLPYVIVSKITKAVFAEYNANIVDAEKSAKATWMNANRQALDAIRLDVMQWTLLGGSCFVKPVPVGAHFAFHIIRRDCFVVLGHAPDGTISSIGTIEKSKSGSLYYTLLEKRSVDGYGLLTIENKLFASTQSTNIGHRVSLQALPQYATLPDCYTYTQPLGRLGLVYIKTPMVNAVDGSADGMSIYEPAIGLIHNINKNERQYSDEFELGRMRIAADREMLKSGNYGKQELKDKLFVGLEAGTGGMGLMAFAPPLRDESFVRRRQGYLKSCENIIGLKRGILSDVEATERTATEITSSEGEYNLTIIDFQRTWFDALRTALTLCDKLGQLYHLCDSTGFRPQEQLSCSWGNGILYDAAKEWEEIMKMVQADMLKPEIALAWKYDLPFDTPEDCAAIREKYMPELTAMLLER
ncbi:MAG: hypothetical protein RSD23_01860 [Ruthenibacterium sp.]